MTEYDYRFDVNLFKSFIGKTFNKYKHHCFSYTNTVVLYAGMMIDGEAYVFENDFEALDFFGWDGEATVSKFRKKNGIAFYHLIRKILSPQKSTKQSSQ